MAVTKRVVCDICIHLMRQRHIAQHQRGFRHNLLCNF